MGGLGKGLSYDHRFDVSGVLSRLPAGCDLRHEHPGSFWLPKG